MKKSLLRLLVVLVLQVAVFFLFFRYWNFDFGFSLLFSFCFGVLIAGLILESHLPKNFIAYLLFILNFIFIVVSFFFFASDWQNEPKSISQNNLTLLKNLEKNLCPHYKPQEIKKIELIFKRIASFQYENAIQILSSFPKKDLFLEKLESYILVSHQNFFEKLALAQKTIPDFSNIYRYYQEGDFAKFQKEIAFYRKKEAGAYFYQLAADYLEIMVNKKALENRYYEAIQKFLKKNNHIPEVVFATLYVFPHLRQKYDAYLLESYEKIIQFPDFEKINSQSKQWNNLFTFTEDYLVIVQYLIQNPPAMPFFGINISLINKNGETKNIEIAKITRNNIIFYSEVKKKFEVMHLKDIAHKITNSQKAMKKPLHPLWIGEYRKDFPEIFQHIIKPYWMKFLRFFLSFLLIFGIAIFTMAYFKTIFPIHLPFYFFILPFFLLIALSFFYTHFALKLFSLFFPI